MPLQTTSCSILNQHLEKVNFDTALTHVGINDSLSNTNGMYVLLGNILKIAARSKMHGISKILVSSVLNTVYLRVARKVSNDMAAKLNLDIAIICKSNRFHIIDNNNISMKSLYKDGITFVIFR